MIKVIKKNVMVLLIVMILSFTVFPTELPRPTYDNSLIISFTYPLSSGSTAEIDYIKSQFGSGIYAPLAFTNFTNVNVSWNMNPDSADAGIVQFKSFVDSLVSKANKHGVGIHIVLSYGMGRVVNLYQLAKEEDIRNAQWYNDNNLSSQAQMSGNARLQDVQGETGWLLYDSLESKYTDDGETFSSVQDSTFNVNKYVYTTPSRYARKLRAHLEAKVAAAFTYLEKKQNQYPDLMIIVSAPGEAELNSLRIDNSQQIQKYFCDYSPFAILEFRDWIKHEGLYGPGGTYDSQGYTSGGSRYQGNQGLANFNSDFATSFTSWDLRFYNWSLSDTMNSDANAIPITNYSYDGMLPDSGAQYISGGFDPPRIMLNSNVNVFWDLWQLFRETMIHNYVKDMASIARHSGFYRSHYYTHQIPADYLWGTLPNGTGEMNPRYYSSASPSWTANAFTDMGVGLTVYDINFGSHHARTTQYLLPNVTNMSDNWGFMEYNPEILAAGVTIDSPQDIEKQIMNLYNKNIHVLSFFKWIAGTNSQVKGTNREDGIKQFFDKVKDKARQSVTRVFKPLKVVDFSATQQSGTSPVQLTWSEKIWSDLNFTWEQWGDFKEFFIYKGYSADFKINASTEIARLITYNYQDNDNTVGGMIYYKIVAVNREGISGSPVIAGIGTGSGGNPVLSVSRDKLIFGASYTGSSDPWNGVVSPAENFLIANKGTGTLDWTITANKDWINCSHASGTGFGRVSVTVDPTAKSFGKYTGTITVSAAGNSSQTINVSLSMFSQAQDRAPFGTFETPLHNSTVSSSIPVTGWVLDDIGIHEVSLYRRESGALKKIGDAILVNGARPDVGQSYPNFPGTDKAGWGYMLLTNFLPNGGNGTFTIVAIATDITGHQTTLGSKTIVVDNARATKPFGAIDTPGQGGEASGTSFVNYGWALTPQPNHIANDGSTIDVYIDGVKIGHPVYNNYRQDIATLFPGYANSQGAVGYFFIDTTQYEDGIHTISWNARDSAGNSDGIGSRYFNISNSANSRVKSARNVAETPKRKLKRLDGIDRFSPVTLKRGNSDPSQKLFPNKRGTIEVEIKQLDRIKLHFPPNTQNFSALPIGSTMDVETGTFYWEAGVAFKGKHLLEFVTPLKNGKMVKQKVAVNIR